MPLPKPGAHRRPTGRIGGRTRSLPPAVFPGPGGSRSSSSSSRGKDKVSWPVRRRDGGKTSRGKAGGKAAAGRQGRRGSKSSDSAGTTNKSGADDQPAQQCSDSSDDGKDGERRPHPALLRRHASDPGVGSSRATRDTTASLLRRNAYAAGLQHPHGSSSISLDEWKRRAGVAADTKVFVISGPYNTAREELLHRGWHENPDRDSSYFDLCWTLKAVDVDHKGLRRHQMANHFPLSTCLTTKVGLCRSLRHAKWSGASEHAFFPRCFDLSEAIDRADFVAEFRIGAALAVLHRVTKLPAFIQHAWIDVYASQLRVAMACVRGLINRETATHDDIDEASSAAAEVPRVAWDALLALADTSKHWEQDAVSTVPMQLLMALVPADKHQEHVRACALSATVVRETTKSGAIVTMTARPPVKAVQQQAGSQLPTPPPPSLSAQQKRALLQRLAASYHTLSSSEMDCLADIRRALAQVQQAWPQAAAMHAGHNWWIVKPAGKSRGRGIDCFNDLNAILALADRRGEMWVAQKYLERPLTIQQRKFDIRQWVLVTCWNPLEVYVYDEMYLRFSGRRFSMAPAVLKDRFVHLCNNSVQRYDDQALDYNADGADKVNNTSEAGSISSNAAGTAEVSEVSSSGSGSTDHGSDVSSQGCVSSDQEAAESQRLPPIPGNMWDVAQFEAWLAEHGRAGAWRNEIMPAMHKVILDTLMTVQETMMEENVAGRCFELYGFDIMLDQGYKPWLIEVNTSPTMEPSTPITARLCHQVIVDVLKVVLDGPAARQAWFQKHGEAGLQDAGWLHDYDHGMWQLLHWSAYPARTSASSLAATLYCQGTRLQPKRRVVATAITPLASGLKGSPRRHLALISAGEARKTRSHSSPPALAAGRGGRRGVRRPRRLLTRTSPE